MEKGKKIGKRERIKQLITLANKISRPTNQIPWNHDQCLIDTNLIFELRMLLRELKAKE
jgi:hypothetical protein